jgi:hypothetical protein
MTLHRRILSLVKCILKGCLLKWFVDVRSSTTLSNDRQVPDDFLMDEIFYSWFNNDDVDRNYKRAP